MPEDETIAVAAAVIERGGCYLLSQRVPGGHGAGMWEFPGGKIEVGESPASALIRELDEELGLAIEVGETLIEIRHRYSDRTVELSFLAASILSGTPRALEVAAFGWYRPEEMPGLPVLPADEALVELLLSRGRTT